MTDKFVSPAAPATPYEREVLDILGEEAAEVIQRASKSKRFGIREIQSGQQFDNAYRLGLEVGDLLEMIDVGITEGLIDPAAIVVGRATKRAHLAKYMQTSKES